MNKKQIEGQLKLSKKQNEDERSDYLCSQFNCVDYLIKLEKYTNNLFRKYKKQKEVIIKVMNLIKKYGKYDGEKCTQGFQMWSADFNKILDILKEASE